MTRPPSTTPTELAPSASPLERALGTALRWCVERAGELTRVTFEGELDENVDLSELRTQLRGAVEFALADVRRINSAGVREWVNFVRDLPHVTELAFVDCSPLIVAQLNMVYNFRGNARVRSFLAPYVCPRCGLEHEKHLDVREHFAAGVRRPPTFTCDRCATLLEFDDLPERYLSFLGEV